MLQPGGLGVLDPGINALSILTALIPTPLSVTSARFHIPSNCATPIATGIRRRQRQRRCLPTTQRPARIPHFSQQTRAHARRVCLPRSSEVGGHGHGGCFRTKPAATAPTPGPPVAIS